ncbi:MAG: ribonuclease H [Halobacteriaceae archaeon]
MAPGGRRLRELFDDSPTPHIAHPPRTHRRDFYVAADGSFAGGASGLGAIIEARTGERVARVAREDDAPDNNVAEYRALHLGLDVLADRAPAGARVGVLVDHDDLAANVNAAALAATDPEYAALQPPTVPASTEHHWRGIRSRIAGFAEVRAARIDSGHNPAHPLANAPERYAHVNREPDRCLLPGLEERDEQIPPPSRSERSGASD